MFAHAEGDFENSKWIMVGIPSEIGSLSNVKHYIEGPESIREGSYRIFDTVLGDINLKEIYDYGDIELEDIKDLNEVYKKIYEEVKKIFRKDKKYIFLGGDHSITYPILKVIKENYDNFYLLYFDAHPDSHPDPYINYQSFILYSIKEEILDPKNIIMVGISNLSFEEKEILKYYNIRYYSSFDVIDRIDEISDEISNIISNNNFYISIDLDVFNKGCGHWLEPFGIDIYHYFKIIKKIKGNIIGFDVVELFPNEFCENFSAKLIVETISLFR